MIDVLLREVYCRKKSDWADELCFKSRPINASKLDSNEDEDIARFYIRMHRRSVVTGWLLLLYYYQTWS